MVSLQARKAVLLERKSVIDKIKIERFLVYFVFFFTLVMESLIVSSALSVIRFINDIAVVTLLVLSVNRFVDTFKRLKCLPILYGVIAFLTFSILSAIINLTPINMFVWGARNTFRGIVFFISTVCFLDSVDLNKIFKILFYVQLINLASALMQYLLLGRVGDAMGGLFGPANNVALGAFNALIYTYFFIAYIRGKESFWKTITMLFSAIIITAIAEEKFGFIFCGVCLLITMFVKGDGKRKFYLALSVISALAVGTLVLSVIFPDSIKVLSTLEGWFSYSQNTYQEGYMIPRVGGIFYIAEHFFEGDPLKILFGFGLGNCDNSQVAIFQSEFYSLYGHYNYRWFSHQWIFLEGGVVGLLTFLSIFVLGAVCLIKQLKGLSRNSSIFCLTSIIMLFYTCITVWVGPVIKNDFSYILYFAFAVGVISLKPFALKKKNGGEDK